MQDVTLESLAARVAALEAELSAVKSAAATPKTDWRSVVGMFDNDPGFLDVIAEGRAIREADRAAAREAADE